MLHRISRFLGGQRGKHCKRRCQEGFSRDSRRTKNKKGREDQKKGEKIERKREGGP